MSLNEIVQYGLGSFKSLDLGHKETCYTSQYDIQLCLGSNLMSNLLFKENKQKAYNFKEIEVNLEPEKLKLNLKWKELLGEYTIEQETIHNIKESFGIVTKQNRPKLYQFNEPLFLKAINDTQYVHTLLPKQNDIENEDTLLVALNYGLKPIAQELTPIKPNKRPQSFHMDNLMFKRKKNDESPFIKVDCPSSEVDVSAALCHSAHSHSLNNIIDSLNTRLITDSYAPFEQYKLLKPVFQKPECHLLNDANFFFLKFSHFEHTLEWNHPIFNDVNTGISHSLFIYPKEADLNSNFEFEFHLEVATISSIDTCIESLMNSGTHTNSIIVPYNDFKRVSIGMQSMLNSMLNDPQSTQIVSYIDKEDDYKPVIEEQSDLKSDATIIVHSKLLQQKNLIKLLQSSCKKLIEVVDTSDTMPSVLVDEHLAILLINGVLFTQLNENNENCGLIELTRLLRHNILKFERIYIYVLNYSMMGKEIVVTTTNSKILLTLISQMPSNCILQTIEHPNHLKHQLICLFDRQSAYNSTFPITPDLKFLMTLPTLNYIHACCIKHYFNTLFEFVEYTGNKFDSVFYKDAQHFLMNKSL